LNNGKIFRPNGRKLVETRGAAKGSDEKKLQKDISQAAERASGLTMAKKKAIARIFR